MATIGDRIGNYVIRSVIGRGAMATVYRVHDERLNRDVALKLLDTGYSLDFIFRARFEREYRVMARISNDHIVPVYDAGSWNDQLYIAMMLVDGPNLAQILTSEGPLEMARVVSIMSQVADALDAAHSERVVHRDVKPANILVARHGQSETEHVYLADFGLTLGMEGTHLTRTGAFMGTLAYSAPEQLTSAPIDGRADEYALAATTYLALTGELPFVRDNEMALVNAHMFDRPPPVTELRPELPTRVDSVVARGMAKRPEDRYRSTGEFAKALATAGASAKVLPAAAGGMVNTSVAALPSTAAGGSRRGRIWVAAIVVALFVAAGLGAAGTFALLSHGSPAPLATCICGRTVPGGRRRIAHARDALLARRAPAQVPTTVRPAAPRPNRRQARRRQPVHRASQAPPRHPRRRRRRPRRPRLRRHRRTFRSWPMAAGWSTTHRVVCRVIPTCWSGRTTAAT